MARVLLGVSGGIAAYKACELLRLLVKAGHDVFPLPTPGAERFVRAETLFALARRPQADDPYPHLARADLLVVAPCTANTLAKLAHGLADNVLTEAALAHRGPILLAPAMNPRMWAHPATQANARLLRERGVHLVGPDEGEMAEGEWGVGRMSEPDEIAARCEELLAPPDRSLAGRRVVVSAGGTREPLDAVRYLGNRSSGRMGFALAAEAASLGADVTVVAANVTLPRDPRVRYVDVETARELQDACARAFADCDVLLMAAAVVDFRPAERYAGKLTKAGGDELHVALERTPDILAGLASARHPGQTIVGFAAEHGDGALARAREKLARKRLDAIVVNDISRADIGFDAQDNEVTIIAGGDETHVALTSKAAVARAVLDAVARLRAQSNAATGPAA